MVPEIRLYSAHPASGLWRLGGQPGQGAGPPPYWGYQWAGGMALARYILDRPDSVAGLRVLDLGAGSGLVAIAAAMSGASEVIAAEIDRNALAALELNAAENGVALTVVGDDLTAVRRPGGSRRGRRPVLRARSGRGASRRSSTVALPPGSRC